MKNSTHSTVNDIVNLLSKKRYNMSKDNATNAVESQLDIATSVIAPVTFTFRPQPIDSDFSEIEGVTYQYHEVDAKGEVVKDDQGNPKPIIARKKPAARREPVVAEIPYPTLAAFGVNVPFALDSNGFPVYESKELQLLFTLVRERIESAARDTLENSAEVDLKKISWELLAVKPKRSSSAVSKEDLESFIEAFSKYLTDEGKAAKGIKFMAQLFKSRCRGVETYANTVIEKVIENIAVYLAAQDAAQQAEYAEVIEYLTGKLQDALVSEEDLEALLD